MSYRTGKMDNLYFGVKILDFNEGGLRTINLFTNTIKRGIALYVIDKKRVKPDDLLFFLFGDTWGRVEWEYWVSGSEDEGEKVCVYDMYVVPNADYLLELVDQVSESSARKWLKENK